MNVAIINKSDSTGGAAVVSRRLMYALRDLGVEASMLVTEKHIDSPYVRIAASQSTIKRAFLAERLRIFTANGFDRSMLFKVDIATDGLPLHRHRIVREADVICLNWVNQGVLSLKGLRELLRLGKPVVWTMHDMWNFTGICHHAGNCTRWLQSCGICPLLGKGASTQDISFSVWNNKKKVYKSGGQLHFVAVSNWLADMARRSPLLADKPLSVIPNAFPMPEEPVKHREHSPKEKFRLLMGAARIDDPVKGLPLLVEATRILKEKYPEESRRMELVTFGNLRDPSALQGIGLPHKHLGQVNGEENIRDVYAGADCVISSSLYETLPGTLVEGLAYGCIPVSFNRGGQSDIVDHLRTGYIAERTEDPHTAAANLAEGIAWASHQDPEVIRPIMLESARERFSAEAVGRRYIDLFNQLVDSK